MQPSPWRYKTAYWIFAFLLAVMTYRTVVGVIDWAWNSTLGDDNRTSVSVNPTPTQDTAEYQWPH